MATKSGITNSPLIGVQNFHVAKLVTDPSTGKATYEEAIHFPWLREVQIKPKTSEATLYADNASVATAKAVSEYDLTFGTATFPLEYKALLLGHKYDEKTGTMSVSSDDTAPYFMVMFQSDKANGKKRFVKFTKVQFAEPEETAQTKEENISYQTPSMTATAIYRACDKVALMQADEEAEGFTEATGANWFKSTDTEAVSS